MKIILIVFVVIVVSCHNTANNTSSSGDSSVSNIDSINPPPPVKTDFTEDSVINIKFEKDSTSITVRGQMRGINSPVTINIPVTKGGQLSALLVPDDTVANIRINQIFMPDGKADGPFGRTVSRRVTEKGTYKLIIAENLMQGDEWKGKFSLTVKVE